GRWREILDAPPVADPDLYRVTAAIQHYAAGVAHAALGDVAAAEAAQTAFQAARDRVPERRKLHNNDCLDLLAVADAMLEGEIAYRRGDHDAAFTHLRRGVALDDGLRYDEPWGWMQPVRHALGALLLEQGRIEEAETAYREDLGLAGSLPRACVHPDNVWSLTGLMACLRARGAAETPEETPEARLLGQRLAVAAARADGPIPVSCFCAGAGASDQSGVAST
ncbi:MAG: hypothetical protein AAFR16_12035, partial [Pseudomonadota bacterium]